MVKILLFGKNGQVGKELQNCLNKNFELIPLSKDSIHNCGNFEITDGVIDSIRKINPDIIINAAAYTQVDKAETEIDKNYQINHITPAAIASELEGTQKLLIHYSSDYVFSGEGTLPWKENDNKKPLNEYGKAKLLGETEIKKSSCKFIILRPSWIYSSNNNNFLTTIIKLANEKKYLEVIDDQIGVPTSSNFVSKTTCKFIDYYINNLNSDKFINQCYNIVPNGETSWFYIAIEIVKQLRENNINTDLTIENIRKIKSKNYAQPAKRPTNSRLNTMKAKELFLEDFPRWENDIKMVVKNIINSHEA
ncbi:dTDP-4-dehydrorhamnose reductase [Pelagibacteraceae bacterium]|mgnify:CR=1 FL=1|nr:dTDP-4-dehydrorhamnose reductase [Pelagibacteraceae bacterium]